MKFRSLMTAICVLATAGLAAAAPFAYVANSGTKNVSVIDTANDQITATVTLPDGYPYGIAVGPSGQYVYVGLHDTNEIAIIDTNSNTVFKRIGLGTEQPGGLAVNAAETRLYVASRMSNTLKVINLNNYSLITNVAIADDASSRPEGVVLSSDGTKAYVADYIAGKVAEISLDEANNVYTRASLTAVGAQPVGLAISSTGSKLYVSSLSGAVKAVDTATKEITDLAVGSGTLSLAITPDNSKVYAPTPTLDKLYVINSAANPNVVLGTQYDIAGAPYNSSVNPGGSKLYMTMYTGTSGETVKVFNTSTNLVDTTIALPTGAKPSAIGDFIGPTFPYTITATNGTDCIISPAGAIPANAGGRKFTITTNAGACEVKVDGVSVGIPSDYAFTNINASHTIDASQAATDTYYTLTVNPLISVDGCLVSTPAGLTCASKSAKFLSGTAVAIKANSSYVASNWTGGCSAATGDTCNLTVTADTTLGATVSYVEPPPAGTGGPVFNVTKSTYHQTCAEATTAASTNDVIKVSTDIASCTTTGTAGVQVKLSSQWKAADYSTKDTPHKALALTITNVAVIVATDTLAL